MRSIFTLFIVVEAFSVIVKTDGSFAALVNTEPSREPRPSYNH